MSTDYSVEAPVVAGRLTIAQIEELVAKPMDTKPDKKFFLALTVSGSALLIGAVCLLYTFYYGIGIGETISRLDGDLVSSTLFFGLE